jgi:hypothetical protein
MLVCQPEMVSSVFRFPQHAFAAFRGEGFLTAYVSIHSTPSSGKAWPWIKVRQFRYAAVPQERCNGYTCHGEFKHTHPW